jgi:NAD(P)H-flavin reductase
VSGGNVLRPARLVGRLDAGGGLTRVIIEPHPEVAHTYTRPGQYVEMHIGGEEGFFVVSSDPGVLPWELVMRSGGGASDVVLASEVGSPLELSGALGNGFALDAARGEALAVVVGGTGVAAGPPVVRRRILHGDARRTAAFVGVRHVSELPLEPELRSWARAGVQVVVCTAQPEEDALPAANPGRGERPEGPEDAGVLAFVRGYVQDVLPGHLPAGWLAGGRIFAVGSAPMVDALRAVAPSVGLDRSRVETNY